MKFYKRKNLDDGNVSNDSFALTAAGRLITDLTASIQVPAGTVGQRPSGATEYNQIRYNTQLFDLEASVRGLWERVRTVRPALMNVQNLGSGNYYSTFFGPLNPSYQLSYDAGAENISVYVDNVFQIPGTNYDLTTDPSPASAVTTGTTAASSLTNNILYLDTVVNVQPGTVVSGSAGINSGTTVVQTITGTFNVQISEPVIGDVNAGTSLTFTYYTGTYVQFSGEVPAKPVVVIQGIDGYFPPG
jgi:hypothetical protein